MPITEAVSTVWDQEWQTLSTAHGNGARSVALYVARHHSDRTLRELAQLTGGMEYPAVTMAIQRLERLLKSDKGLAKKIQRVFRPLQVKFKLIRDPIRSCSSLPEHLLRKARSR